MLALIEFHYSTSAALDKLTRDDWNALREEVSQLNFEEWKEAAEKRPYWSAHDKILVDLATDGPALTRRGISFEVKNFKGTYRATGTDARGVTHELHIHVPNIGLLAMDEVRLLDDACTDSLQSELNDGWRIIAVCPPNSQRRPDYILGRSKS